MPLCAKPGNSVIQLCIIFIIVWSFIFLNSSFIKLFYAFRNLQHDSIPGLSSQMKTNLYIIPFMFFTTIILALTTAIITGLVTGGGKDPHSHAYYNTCLIV